MHDLDDDRSAPSDPRVPWIALATALRCRPRLDVRGRPSARMTLAGALEDCQVRLWFDAAPRRVEAWITADDHADSIAFAATTRLCPRDALPGWGAPDPTGDPAFDATVLVLTDELEGLLRQLDATTRALATDLVGRGAQTFDGGVWLPAQLTAQAQTAEAAADLLDAAIHLAKALKPREIRAEAGVLLAADRQAPHVAAAAASWLRRPRKAGGPGVYAILSGIAQLAPEDQVPWLLESQPTTDAEWAQWVARALPLDHPAIETHLEGLLKSRVEQRGRLTELAAHRLIRGLERGGEEAVLQRLAGVVLLNPSALEPVLARALEGSPAVIGWLSGLRFGAEPGPAVDLHWRPSQWRVAYTLLSLGSAEAQTRLAQALPDSRVPIREFVHCLKALAPTRAQALVSHWVEVLAEARGEDADALLDALLPWFELRPLPPAVDALMARCGEALLETAATRLPARCASETQRGHAARFLVATLRDRPRRVPMVLTALEKLGTRHAEPFLLQALAAGESALRPALVAALGTCGTLACVPALEKLDGFFEDRVTRAIAREALALVRARGWLSDAGGLSVSAGALGGLSPEDPGNRG